MLVVSYLHYEFVQLFFSTFKPAVIAITDLMFKQINRPKTTCGEVVKLLHVAC